MPDLIIPPGFAQNFLRWRLSGDNEEMLSSIGVRLQAGVSDPALVAQALAGDWAAQWGAAGDSNAYTFVGVTTYIGSDGDPTVGEHILNRAGTGSLAPLPNNSAVLVRKVTALGGRRNRGRMFVPPVALAENTVDPTGTIASATLTGLQSNMTGFLTAIQTDPTFYDAAVLFHSAAPSTPTVITALTVQARIATQRERMRR